MRKRKLGSRVTLTLALAILAVAIGLRSGIFFAAIPPQFFVVVDNGGPNDVAGQKDINMMGRWDDLANNALDVFWSWDKINPEGQSFDACALFDANGNGNIDYAICANVINTSGNNSNPIPKLSTMPQVYKCNDTDTTHCVGYSTNPQPSVPSLTAGNLAGNFGGTADDLRTNTDPFPGPASNKTGDDYPNDTTLRIRFNKSEIPAKLANVCTYPSAAIDTSVASDCIANPGGGFLKIVKNVTAGDGTFTFDVNPVPSANNGGACDPPAVGCQSYSVTTTNLTGYTGVSLAIGQNSVTVKEHDQKPAYTFTNAFCQIEGNPPTPTGSLDVNNLTMNGVTILADTITTCTFVNAKQPAKLTVTKVVVNDNGGTASVGDYTLTVGDQAFASGTQATIAEGTYTVAESGPTAGYAATFSGNCDASGNITMAAGGTYTCTITNNDIAPKLTLSKIVTTDNGGAANASSFTLTATGLTSFSGAGSVTSGLGFKAGTYTLTESGPTGYSASAWSCSGGSQSGNQITLGLAQTVTCTITNDDIQPKLIVIKKMKNDNGGTNVSSDFTMTVTGSAPSPASFQGSATGATVLLNAGSYSVGESGPSGYAAGISGDCSGTIAVGETKTCTITNDDAAGSLTIIKHVINDNSGTASAGDFTMHVDDSVQPSDNNFPGSENGVTIAINAGAYNVTETGGPSGYAASFSAGCSGTMTSGGNITCTITNDDKAPKLTLVKKVTNDNGGNAAATAWTLSAAGPSLISGAGGATSGATFQAGSYNLSESGGPSGYTASAWSCVGGSQSGSSIALSVGESATCTITNNDIAPSLTLLKVVSTGSGNDPAAPPSAFTISANGGTLGSLSGPGSGVSSGPSFQAGTYNLSESGPSGYTANGWSCAGGSQSGSQIALTIGQSATCAITNTLNNIPPTIKVDKTANPKNLDVTGGTVTFTVTVTNTSGIYDPFTITSIFDTVYGDLTNPAAGDGANLGNPVYKQQDNNSCGNAVGYVIPGGGTYVCTWQSYFPPLAANQTLTEYDVVTINGQDDDNAGVSSLTSGSDDASVTQVVPMMVTDSSLCVFDTDLNTPGRQFNRIFTQTAAYGLTATNPGQFYYNVAIHGNPGETVNVSLELPWPFVTQGNMPIHVYTGVDFKPRTDCPGGGLGYVPTGEIGSILSHVQLGDYVIQPPAPASTTSTTVNVTSSTYWGYASTAGVAAGSVSVASAPVSTKTITVTFPVTFPAGVSFLYINQHMDDGLKGSKVDVNGDGIIDNVPYLKDGILDAIDPTTARVLIPQNNNHVFRMNAVNSLNVQTVAGDDSVYNTDLFKKSVGVSGVVNYTGDQLPLVGLQVLLKNGSGVVVGAAFTDADGYYAINYKHTGKAADYVVELVNPLLNATVASNGATISGTPGSTTKTVTLKSNAFVEVDFPLLP